MAGSIGGGIGASTERFGSEDVTWVGHLSKIHKALDLFPSTDREKKTLTDSSLKRWYLGQN